MYRINALTCRHLLRHHRTSATATAAAAAATAASNRTSSRLLNHGCIGIISDATVAAATTSTAQPQHNHHKLFRRSLILQEADEIVRIERFSGCDSGIIGLKLDRPESKNAINKEMMRGLQNALEVIEGDSSLNVAVISSSVPRFFCAGADLKERRPMSPSEVQTFVNSLRSTMSSLEELSVPTIAVIEGAALGGGLELVLSCDLRICGEDALFSLPETGLAVIPGAGGTQRLPRIIGRSMAKELIFTGRRVKGREALSMGLVNHCVPAGEAYAKALQIAREINEKAPLAVKMAKKAINKGIDDDICSALAIEEECYTRLLNTEDRLEGLAAFAEKRKPKYSGK